MIKYSKLKGKMTEKGMTLRKLSRLTGISISTLSDKFNGKSEFKVSEIQKISDILNLDSVEVYFFDN